MEALGSLVNGLVGLGCSAVVGLLPLVLVIVALVDIVRSGAAWYWIPIVFLFPLIGPIVYFVAVRSPLGQGGGGVSPDAARRRHAQRRLREIDVQLAHWQGPAILAEAGEHLLTLGKPKEAEQRLRAALAAGADIGDVALPLAEALEAQRRWGEAAPFLEQWVAVAPPYRLADAWLHLGRCRDESNASPEAMEAALRAHLEHGSSLEAKVRLARCLLRRSEGEEAQRLIAAVESEYKLLPNYLRAANAPWRRAARRLSLP